MNDPDRDRALERLLRQPGIHAGPGPGDDCLDAEAMAAWMDGGLDPSAAALVESHMTSCARCQALVATMARTESAGVTEGLSSGAADVPWWRMNIRWLVPITAGITAGLLWTVIPDQQRTSSIAEQQVAPPAGQVAPPAPAAPAPSAASPKASTPEAASPPPEVAPQRERLDATPRLQRNEQAKAAEAPSPPAETVIASQEPRPMADQSAAAPVAQARPAAPPPAPAPAAPEAAARVADAPLFTARVPLEIPTPDAEVRWRVSGPTIGRTVDGGSTWTTRAITPPADIQAGSAPSRDICWLVGSDGVVWLTTDGNTWRRVTAPSPDDLVGVSATDGLNAVVRSADGQTFRTEDGGVTWVAQ